MKTDPEPTTVVEIDSENQATYVRFSKNQVDRTLVARESAPLFTVDYDHDQKSSVAAGRDFHGGPQGMTQTQEKGLAFER